MKVRRGKHVEGLRIPTPYGFLPAMFDEVVMDARWLNCNDEFNIEATTPTGEVFLLNSIDLDFLD